MAIEKLEFHSEATADYEAAFDWYLARSAEVAESFDTEFDRALAQIAENPQRWVIGPFNTRRYLLRRFPFLLIYREKTDSIQVIAVAHTSRRPNYWKKRL